MQTLIDALLYIPAVAFYAICLVKACQWAIKRMDANLSEAGRYGEVDYQSEWLKS